MKGELMERYKVLPALSSRLSELENQNEELREKNRQMEQKLATMQVPPFRWWRFFLDSVGSSHHPQTRSSR